MISYIVAAVFWVFALLSSAAAIISIIWGRTDEEEDV